MKFIFILTLLLTVSTIQAKGHELMSNSGAIIAQQNLIPVRGLKGVVVSGQSVTGMTAAAIAAQSGHQVDVYDLRMSYTRDIQWSSRQSAADILASIDLALAEKFRTEVAQDLKRGFMEIRVDGSSRPPKPGRLITPDPRRIPQIGERLLDFPVVANVQTRRFEQLLYDYLSHHPNVVQKKGKIEIGPIDLKTGDHLITEFEDITPLGQKEKVYKVIRSGNPLTVIAEGASSASRASLGIESAPSSPERLQIAGVLDVEQGGEIVTQYRKEAPGKMVTTSMGTIGTNKRWVVGDIDAAKITPDSEKFGSFATSPEYKAEAARLLEIEFKRIGSLNLRMPLEKVLTFKATGAIEGLPLQTFKLRVARRLS